MKGCNMSFILQLICMFHVLQLSQYADGAPPEHRITSLPGWDGDLPSKQYSGYLNITTSKHYHYWFIEAENDPENAPVVLWLNGGPGCSSLSGLLDQHGPFRINDSTVPPTLYRFKYTWAKLANMIYLESPVGVGFTYSDDDTDYRNTDETTMMDNLLAVEKFFELFPEEKRKDFYMTGESYAGIYVPTLAEGILEKTLNGSYKGAPLKGIAVGNGCTGTDVGVCRAPNTTFQAQYFVETTAFVKPDLKKRLNENCTWDTPYDMHPDCYAAIQEMKKDLRRINAYGVYNDCIWRQNDIHTSITNKSGTYNQDFPLGQKHLGMELTGYDIQEYGPAYCIQSNAADAYLNQDAVIEAIHVKKQSFNWWICGRDGKYRYEETRPNLPRDTYPFLAENIRILIFNGDWDASVPYTDNIKWTKDMGFDIVEDWHQWFYNNSISHDNFMSSENPIYQWDEVGEQVGGYAIRYANDFTFTTIRGGSHEASLTTPASSFEMLRRFLKGIDF